VLTKFTSVCLSRRRILSLVAGAAIAGNPSRLFGASDFWNKKDPKDWTNDEIDRLTTNSPWAKPVSAQVPLGSGSSPGSAPGGSSGSGRRIGLGIPGLGIPGVGGYPGGGGGWPGGGRRPGAYQVKGVVLWQSAQPVRDAIKPEFPEEFADHLVIALVGFPFPLPDDNRDEDEALSALKSDTYLRPEHGNAAQPGVVKRPVSSSINGGILFGFSQELIKIGPEDQEILFTTRLGRSQIQARFVPKEMLYRGKLAV